MARIHPAGCVARGTGATSESRLERRGMVMVDEDDIEENEWGEELPYDDATVSAPVGNLEGDGGGPALVGNIVGKKALFESADEAERKGAVVKLGVPAGGGIDAAC